MSNAAPHLRIEPHGEGGPQSNLKSDLQDTHTEELIIGLCGPIGSHASLTAERIKQVLANQFNYDVIPIKLSTLIRVQRRPELDELEQKQSRTTAEEERLTELKEQEVRLGKEDTPYLLRYSLLIDKGNDLRRAYGPNVLAALAVNEIGVIRQRIAEDRKKREEEEGQRNQKEGEASIPSSSAEEQSVEFKSARVCYIIDSIKNKEEVELLKLVYADLFYFIGVSTKLRVRVANLEGKGISKSDVYALVDRDSGEGITFGQQVTETFIRSDFFLSVDTSNTSVLDQKLLRYFHLVFNSRIVTPTDSESAMYQAYAAASNSACLSRQVGASIINRKGDLLAIGWNEVPKAKGGVYKTNSISDIDSVKDFRCMYISGGKCHNDEEKTFIRDTILDKLITKGLLDPSKKGEADKVLRTSRIKELIEFSRAVHAEMHAIIAAGMNAVGPELIGAKLYTTAYPCHNCARHIVVAGIEEVYYIEPYTRSLALRLHSDSLTEEDTDDSKVRILPYDGVSPRRYQDFFNMIPLTRKVDGKYIPPALDSVKPRNTVSLQAIPLLEKQVHNHLEAQQLL